MININGYTMTRQSDSFTNLPFGLDLSVATACLILSSQLRVAAADPG